MGVHKTIKWTGGIDGCVELIDQTLLPGELRIMTVRDVETMVRAIKNLQVRGAPAIGIAGAYGVVLGLGQLTDDSSRSEADQHVKQTCGLLATSRPTAVNLFWALERMQKTAFDSTATTAGQLKAHLLTAAEAIRDEDAEMCRAIGGHGAGLIKDGFGVLTHCNAGGLATAEYGTALAIMYRAHEQGRRFRVYADETRPLLQGARLTAWELKRAGIDTMLICDNMAGMLMSQGKVDMVVTGADRIASNGDTANKIGTYSLARLADVHGIPFYIAAPSSTFDMAIASGDEIPIEQRSSDEVTGFAGCRTAPVDVDVYNPAFDVTPFRYITAIITERGIIESPGLRSIRRVLM